MDTNETKIYLAVLLASFVLGIILVFFMATIIRHQKKSAQLYEQQLKAEITILEEERKRVASDLHDDLAPFISAIKLQVNSLNTADEEDMLVIERASNYLDQIFMKVREISNDLVPAVLLRKGLLVAIEEFAESIKTKNNLSIRLDFNLKELKLETGHEIHLYRIIQEAIHNCIRHANATEFMLSIEGVNSMLKVQLGDNGKGYDFQKMTKESIGSGLRNIARRVDILQGELYLGKPSNTGVMYTIEIPIKAKA